MERLSVSVFIFITLWKVSMSCDFPTAFQNTQWHDNKRGDITFTTDTLTGWSMTVHQTTLSTWTCLDNSDSSKLVMKATDQVQYGQGSQVYFFNAYICMALTKITDNSYSYYLRNPPEFLADYDRVDVSLTTTPLTTASQVCNTSIVVPTLEFHVMVKSGMEAAAAIMFPDELLFSGDYNYVADDGTVSCNGTQDTMDMCTDTTTMSFTYSSTTCTQKIAYSDGGQLNCVAKITTNGYSCAVVYNLDSTISSPYTQFACICTDGTQASVAPNNCTSNQNVTHYPTDKDGLTAVGYLLQITSKYVPTTTTAAPSDSRTNVGLIVGIVIALLLIIAIIVVAIILYKMGKCVAILAFLKSKCFCCCRNKVDREEKPILENGALKPHVVIIDETSRRPKLEKEKTTMSAITRSSSRSIARQATMTSIGLDMKSDRGEKSNIMVKSNEEESKPRLQLFGKDLSFLVCCPEKKDKEEAAPQVVVVSEEPKVGKKTVKGGKNGDKTAKGKAKGKAKGGKNGKNGKTNQEEQTENEKVPNGGLPHTPRATSTPIPGEATSTPIPGGKKKDVSTPAPEVQNGVVSTPATEVKKREVSTPAPEIKKGIGSTPTTKVKKGAVSTPATEVKKGPVSTQGPGGKKGVVSITNGTAAIMKPDGKPNEWTFLACCFGNRSPPPEEPKEPEVPAPKAKPIRGAAAGKAKPGAKKGTGGAKKGAGKKGTKGSKKAINEKDLSVEDLTDGPEKTELQGLERAKTLPERPREKTVLSLVDAGKVKVDVYVPDEKTNLQLKDTVTVVKSKKGDQTVERSKTALGVVRPPSVASASPTANGTEKTKSDKKGKKTSEKGKKDKKTAKKKKK